jgi:hypothetical protein
MPRRTGDDGRDPNDQFLGEQSQAGSGSAGLELALHRLVRWLMTRTRKRG